MIRPSFQGTHETEGKGALGPLSPAGVLMLTPFAA